MTARTSRDYAAGFSAGLEAAAALKEQDAKAHRKIALEDRHMAQDARLMAAVCKSDAFRIRALKGDVLAKQKRDGR